MRKAPLTGLTTGTFDDVLVRNPPYSGPLVSVTSLGGGTDPYDDTEVRSLITTTAQGLLLKHPNITVVDSAGASHSGVTTLSAIRQSTPRSAARATRERALPPAVATGSSTCPCRDASFDEERRLSLVRSRGCLHAGSAYPGRSAPRRGPDGRG